MVFKVHCVSWYLVFISQVCHKVLSCVFYLIVRQGDGRVKHSPEDTLIAGRSGEGALVPEEMVEVLWEHGAHVQAGYVHGLTCNGGKNQVMLNGRGSTFSFLFLCAVAHLRI